MINLIMLCGQGSVGKSTYARRNFQESSIVGFDKIIGQREFNWGYLEPYLNLAQQKLDNQEEFIVLDFAYDTIECRKLILSQLKIPDGVNFTTISFRPGVKQIIINQEKRQKKPLTKQEIEKIIELYNAFMIPTEEEFKCYNFNEIKNIIIDDFY